MVTGEDSLSRSKEGAGILIRSLKQGESERFPKPGDSCVIRYECMFEDGTKVDSARNQIQPLQFELGAKQVIQGLEVAVQRMSVGQKVEATIPHLYAYGQRGHPPEIPPRSTLIFRLELLAIEEKDRKR